MTDLDLVGHRLPSFAPLGVMETLAVMDGLATVMVVFLYILGVREGCLAQVPSFVKCHMQKEEQQKTRIHSIPDMKRTTGASYCHANFLGTRSISGNVHIHCLQLRSDLHSPTASKAQIQCSIDILCQCSYGILDKYGVTLRCTAPVGS